MNKAKVHFNDSFAYYHLAYFLKDYLSPNTLVVCIGTDSCIGDSLGPLIGTMLIERHFPLPVFGTISEPIHALNLTQKLTEITELHPNSNIIGIDACLGDADCIGQIQFRDNPIHPGKGVGKSLPLVGETSIIGIVDSNINTELFTIRTIRLNLIFEMSKVIVDALSHAIYLYNIKNN